MSEAWCAGPALGGWGEGPAGRGMLTRRSVLREACLGPLAPRVRGATARPVGAHACMLPLRRGRSKCGTPG